ncbi:hypothetical protein M2202_004856 [Bradyrhizobium japonicum]|nr:hypothetical protein [Bradyrhizobium japonicum]MCP1788470.1 hypothetical protein [Bradyrhizobium japonicum]MCP1810345.1 hypothetical protein [Bradyrhizobium japonicum]MCP1819279.1 hypothetical protein [Bradyrhizobium japonicum]MCP1869211.1 hypothetical protein [Bradyrhizobium japonicum]
MSFAARKCLGDNLVAGFAQCCHRLFLNCGLILSYHKIIMRSEPNRNVGTLQILLAFAGARCSQPPVSGHCRRPARRPVNLFRGDVPPAEFLPASLYRASAVSSQPVAAGLPIGKLSLSFAASRPARRQVRRAQSGRGSRSALPVWFALQPLLIPISRPVVSLCTDEGSRLGAELALPEGSYMHRR